jgi:hypothetical protein
MEDEFALFGELLAAGKLHSESGHARMIVRHIEARSSPKSANSSSIAYSTEAHPANS